MRAILDAGSKQPSTEGRYRAGPRTTGHRDLLALALLIGLAALDGDDEALIDLGDVIDHQGGQLGPSTGCSKAEAEDGPITKPVCSQYPSAVLMEPIEGLATDI